MLVENFVGVQASGQEAAQGQDGHDQGTHPSNTKKPTLNINAHYILDWKADR